MLYSMTIRLIHVHQLETPYVMGSNVNMGSFGVTGVKVIYIKQAITLPCYIAWSYMVNLTYPLASDPLSHLQDQQASWGQSGVEVSKPAGYAVCDGNVSSFFFFLLATHLFHTLPYIWFWPNLLTVTGTLTTTHTLKMVGSGVTMGSLGSKRSFSPKTHQVLQIT